MRVATEALESVRSCLPSLLSVVCSKDSQDTEAQDDDDAGLCLLRHLNLPDHGYRHEGVEPVGKNGHDAECVSAAHDLAWRSALEVLDGEVPLRLDGVALEQVPEERDEGPDGDDAHADPENPLIPSLHRQTEEKGGDAKLDEHHVQRVRWDVE